MKKQGICIAGVGIEAGVICPLKHVMNLAGSKWKMPILCMLSFHEPLRYSDIKRRLHGITNMMLAQSLKEMEADGMVLRKQFNEVPPHVEYRLNEKGSSLVPLLLSLSEWGIGAMDGKQKACVYCNECIHDK